MVLDKNKKVSRTKVFVDLMKQKKDGEDSDADFRDKNKEFKETFELLRKNLSPEALETIKENPEKMKEIIEGLRKRGELGAEYDVKLEKFASKIVRKSRDEFYKQK